VARKPNDEPINVDGTRSQIKGEVDEITMAKPSPYPMDRKSNNGNRAVKGNISSSKPLMTEPAIIGVRLPALSDILPMNGLAMIRAIIWLPVITLTKNMFIFTTSTS
jgi:hypothetical protein